MKKGKVGRAALLCHLLIRSEALELKQFLRKSTAASPAVGKAFSLEESYGTPQGA